MDHKSNMEKAFLKMIRENERVIYKVCSLYITNNYSLADLYQEVVCNLWIGFPRFRNESSFSTWIYRIALNTCISGLRKEVKRPGRDIPVSALQEILMEPEGMSEQIKEMYALIQQLRTVERAIVLLWLEEKTYQEIADITGLTVSNVATKLKRSKQKLKELSNR